jgi:hypothetical protein
MYGPCALGGFRVDHRLDPLEQRKALLVSTRPIKATIL